jgi:hypothetical protein
MNKTPYSIRNAEGKEVGFICAVKNPLLEFSKAAGLPIKKLNKLKYVAKFVPPSLKPIKRVENEILPRKWRVSPFRAREGVYSY